MAETDENFEELIAQMEAEEKGEKVEAKPIEVAETKSTELIYPHEDILEEEGLTKEDMPADIRKMIITFDRKMRMAIAKKAPEKTFLQIQNLSTLIADKIITYLESSEVKREKIVVEKKEDGGGIDDGGIDDGGENGDGIDDLGSGDTSVEDDLEDGGEASGETPPTEKGGLFDGVLGGIFNW